MWELIEIKNIKSENFYGGEIWNDMTYSNFFNSPKVKGLFFSSRRRHTEIIAKEKIHSPSPTFNCVGPGAVGTGTLAGLRILNKLKHKTKIWPFDDISFSSQSVIVESFLPIIFDYLKPNQKKK